MTLEATMEDGKGDLVDEMIKIVYQKTKIKKVIPSCYSHKKMNLLFFMFLCVSYFSC
ncbi:hypothetical protein Bca101_059583 [Brassica carinata]